MPHNHKPSVDANLTAVAIDKDKNSSSAVKWAIEHLLPSNPTIILIHVRIRPSQSQSFGGDIGLCDADMQQLFKASRVYCARKGIRVQEVTLEDTDVSRAILDFISENNVKNIVLGASSRNPIARKFWSLDVPTIVNKAAPEFCSVYVIAKGKTQSYRPAARFSYSSVTPPSSVTPKQQSPRNQSPNRYKPGDVSRESSKSIDQKGVGSAKVWPRIVSAAESMENYDISFVAPKNYSSRDSYGESDFSASLHFGRSMDSKNSHTLESTSDGSSTSSSSLEDEMNKLKRELQQTLDMYNSVCKEAVSAQHKAREIDQWKSDENQKIEQSRLAEEAALALVEMEKAKSKAAIEAAEKAQKLAEIEARRRKQAEEKAKYAAEEKNRALTVMSRNDSRYRKYTIEEIEIATNKFAQTSKIGEGGYGPVYKGKLDHTPVAIKILRSDAAQGMKQFQQEIEVLSCIRHPNMVLLLGACPEYGCLVYEFMNNGSLEDRLFRKGNSPPIPWAIRFRIASDIATGLLFLHQAKPEPLVHRDLKPANILLDNNFVCKISDVGLARLVPPTVADTVTQYHMTSAAGTFCYIDPEYQHTGKLGTKSDIYSLGVMLLQILTARPPMGLTHHVEKAINRGTFGDLLDPTVPDWPIEEALGLAKLAMQCAELRKKDRPSLSSVILPELNRLKELGRSVTVKCDDDTEIPPETTTTTPSSSSSSSSSPGLLCISECATCPVICSPPPSPANSKPPPSPFLPPSPSLTKPSPLPPSPPVHYYSPSYPYLHAPPPSLFPEPLPPVSSSPPPPPTPKKQPPPTPSYVSSGSGSPPPPRMIYSGGDGSGGGNVPSIQQVPPAMGQRNYTYPYYYFYASNSGSRFMLPGSSILVPLLAIYAFYIS
ncbi:OLC1v1029287C1 [Oldenlandia corymbosa var. corymbosa]|uniref:RING-type E3 ubiquitin transferase n=1 Tax=Oldenlandia corymbosa var. corymbosa TaxID=529605 RepID=A0AAV1CGI4_OLDCO|nr:OLC1v1029287C1 [Oldenlandia corymbosa var. corymbosa]